MQLDKIDHGAGAAKLDRNFIIARAQNMQMELDDSMNQSNQ